MKYLSKKQIKKYFYLIGFSILSISSMFAQSGTTQGTDFWVSFGGNSDFPASYLTMQIKIVASQTATVTLTFTEKGTSENPVTVQAGNVYTYTLTNTEKNRVFSNTTTSTPSKKSLHIHSDKEVSVYAINQYAFPNGSTEPATTDATNVLPVNALGTNYYHLSYTTKTNSFHDGYIIIATEDNTEISVGGTKKTLNKGQVYSHFQSTNETGTHITSDKPVAYFVTNEAVNIPTGKNDLSCLFQQMYPVNTWGKRFFVPVTIRTVERIRIFASQNGTQITQSGGSIKAGSLSLSAGQFVELEASANSGCYITSTQPVAVCSYLVSKEISGIAGDPAMVWIPPVEQYVTSTMLTTFQPSSSLLGDHLALIVTPTATRDQTKKATGTGAATALTTPPSSWPQAYTWFTGSGGYSFRSEVINNSSKSYSFSNPYGLAVLVYGIGYDESYYYLAGSGAANLLNGFFVNEIYYEEARGKTFCDDEIQLRTSTDYTGVNLSADYLIWEIDGKRDIADINQWNLTKTLLPGPHTVKLIANGDETDAAITNFTIEVLNVSIDGGAKGVVIGGTLTLTPNTGGTWVSNNPTVATVTADGIVTGVSDGMADFTFTSANGCSATTDKITVATVYPPHDPSDFYVNDIISATVNGMTFCNDEVHFRTVKDYTNETTLPTFKWVIDGKDEPAGNDQWDWTTTLTAGSHTVQLVVDGDETNAVSTTFTIEILTVSISGATSIEVGTTTTLSSNTRGIWLSDNPTVATVTTGGIVVGVSEGTATFTFTSNNGCTATTDAVTVLRKRVFLPVNRINFYEQ